MSVTEGKLVAVVGQVGAGKSSLISALLGDMEVIEGQVKTRVIIIYTWLFNFPLLIEKLQLELI